MCLGAPCRENRFRDQPSDPLRDRYSRNIHRWPFLSWCLSDRGGGGSSSSLSRVYGQSLGIVCTNDCSCNWSGSRPLYNRVGFRRNGQTFRGQGSSSADSLGRRGRSQTPCQSGALLHRPRAPCGTLQPVGQVSQRALPTSVWTGSLSVDDPTQVFGCKLVRGRAGLGVVARKYLRPVPLALGNDADVESRI